MTAIATPLAHLKDSVDSSKGRLTLDEKALGRDGLNLFGYVFNKQPTFELTGCSPIAMQDGRLVLKGRMISLSPWKDVEILEIALFDHPDTGDRHCVFQASLPGGVEALPYLLRFYRTAGESDTGPARLAGTNLDDVVASIAFSSGTKLVVSTYDYAGSRDSQVYVPEYMKDLKVGRGINFGTSATPDPELTAYVQRRFFGDLAATGFTRGLIGVQDGDDHPVLVLTGALGGTISGLDMAGIKISVEVGEVSLEVPLASEGESGPRILVSGAIKIGEHALDVVASHEPYYEALQISVTGLPSLGEAITYLGAKSSGNPGDWNLAFPDALNPILSAELSDLHMNFSLAHKKIDEVGFALTHKKALRLIPGVIELFLSLEMEITEPFHPEFRTVEGILTGHWKILHPSDGKETLLTTSVYYPGLNFFIELDTTERSAPLTLRNLLELGKIVNKNELPEAHSQTAALMDIGLVALSIEGEIEACSFQASIGIATDKIFDWKFGEHTFRISRVGMSMAYGNSKLSHLGVDAICEIDKVRFFLAGEWQPNEGFTFSGGLVSGDKIQFGSFLNGIEKSIRSNQHNPPFAFPEPLKHLEIRSLGLWFNTHTGDFTFSCEVATSLGGQDGELTGSIFIKRIQNSYTFDGDLFFEGHKFKLTAEANTDAKTLKASWDKQPDGPELDFASLGKSLGTDQNANGLAPVSKALKLPQPTSVELKIALTETETSVDLSCTLDMPGHQVAAQSNELAAALHVSKKAAGQWAVAAGVRVQELSIKDMGALGSALHPYNIALKNLTILAANVSLQDSKFKLGNVEFAIQQGLMLKGKVAFEKDGTPQPLFEKDFECLLFGEPAAAIPASGPTISTGQSETRDSQLANATLAAYKPELGDNGAKHHEAPNNVEVGHTFGPFTFRKARFENRGAQVHILLDASIGAGGVELDLYDFDINFPLDALAHFEPSKLGVGLGGIGVSYANPPLTISGGLRRIGEAKENHYQGDLMIKAAIFQIAVLGEYQLIDESGVKKVSVFVFGSFSGLLGGPPPFVVTGIALGGGYNSKLTIPAVEKVKEFPLIAAVMAPESFGTIRSKLHEFIEPSAGDYWLAVGVRFTSFKLADSFVLLSVAFGNRLQLALTGLTTLAVPPKEVSPEPAVKAQLAIRAVLDPEGGVISLEGRLTEESYVLSEKLRLTGGFAFFVWFGNNSHAGDFVITLGGYHPLFVPPPHYPVVPRLGIAGQLSTYLSVLGEIYFAITPSCVMGGLRFEAVFAHSGLRAAFLAYADFLFAWAPFHYDARIGIAIAVSYQPFSDDTSGGGCAIKLELDANLHVWGPPLAGIATVHFAIFEFTVEFGARGALEAPARSWQQFQDQFLKPTESEKKPAEQQITLCSIRVADGILREVQLSDAKKTIRIVNPHELTIATDSMVPCTEVGLGEKTFKKTGDAGLGVRPMGTTTSLCSKHKVDLKWIDHPGVNIPEKFNAMRLVWKNFPEALWSPKTGSDTPDAELLKNVPAGIVLKVKPVEVDSANRIGPIPIAVLEYEDVNHKILLRRKSSVPAAAGEFETAWPDTERKQKSIRAILDAREASKADQRLRRSVPWNDPRLTLKLEDIHKHFQAEPGVKTPGDRLGSA